MPISNRNHSEPNAYYLGHEFDATDPRSKGRTIRVLTDIGTDSKGRRRFTVQNVKHKNPDSVGRITTISEVTLHREFERND